MGLGWEARGGDRGISAACPHLLSLPSLAAKDGEPQKMQRCLFSADRLQTRRHSLNNKKVRKSKKATEGNFRVVTHSVCGICGIPWKRRKGPHPHTLGISKKITRFTKGRFRPY